MNHTIQDMAVNKASAGAAVVGTFLGFTISEWAALLTVIFVLMQIIVLSPKFYGQLQAYYKRFRAWRLKRVSSKRAPPPQ